jgi:hypothetical protein
MNKVKKYKQLVHKIINEVADMLSKATDLESMLLIDNINGQYMLMSDGWEGIERHYGPVVHIEVKKDGKVWLRYDGTDLEIGQTLLKKGVLPMDLVPAFHSPQARVHAGYAVA